MGSGYNSYGFDDIQDVQDKVDRQEFSYRRDDPVTTTLQFMHDREQFVLTCNVISATLVWVDPDRSALVSVETDCCWYRFMLQKLLRQDSSGAWFVVGYDSQPREYGPFLTLRTQNVDEAQQNIPFEIVLPTYLPGNMESPPWISGPVGNNSDGDFYLVSLNYISAEPDVHSTAFITIQESNQPGNDSVKTGYGHEVIDGVEVLWYSSPVPDTDEALDIRFCHFVWNQEGHRILCRNFWLPTVRSPESGNIDDPEWGILSDKGRQDYTQAFFLIISRAATTPEAAACIKPRLTPAPSPMANRLGISVSRFWVNSRRDE